MMTEPHVPPPGFAPAYARVVADPASATQLSALLALVGYEASEETIERWSLARRVQAEVYAVNTHLRASDNPLRPHPKPEWLPEPWGGSPEGEGILETPGGTPL